MITLTEQAAAKVAEIASAEGLDHHGLRVRVIGAGRYDLYFEDKVDKNDQIFESRGVKLYVDPTSLKALEGAEIDYVDGADGPGFKFNTAAVTVSCDCGASVSF